MHQMDVYFDSINESYDRLCGECIIFKNEEELIAYYERNPYDYEGRVVIVHA